MNEKEKILNLAIKAKKSSTLLPLLSSEKKNYALEVLKKNLDVFIDEIITENVKDIKNAHKNNLSSALIDRLTLTKDRIKEIIKSLDEIIKLDDPIGNIISEWERPNGLHIQKISTPIGVIGIIYESRPNVTIDASAIAIKSSNAIILRGGKDSFESSHKLKEIINEVSKNIDNFPDKRKIMAALEP